MQGVTTVRTGSDGVGEFSRRRATKARWEAGGIGANAVMMVPFSVIRREVMGDDNLRPATPEEVARMRSIVRQGMNEGAWGISTGLEYGGLNIYSSTEEVIEVTEPVAEFGGVYISHMRDEAGSILEAGDEIIRISEGAGVPVQITHLKAAGRDNWGKMRRVVDMVNEARARGVPDHGRSISLLAGCSDRFHHRPDRHPGRSGGADGSAAGASLPATPR